ncbi:MAG: hypothetical protein HUJ93_01315 [Bacteroidales bacterium]|nr:hypothetical protein [Bacteroidales bacterium]
MVYIYKASIPGSKTFMREYEVKANMDLFSFNSFITNDLGFSPGQMVLFVGYNGKGDKGGRYGMFDLGDGSMDKVTFEALVRKGEVSLRYCYDLRSDSAIVLNFEGEAEDSPRRSYPRVTGSKGQNPDQFGGVYEDIETYDPTKDPDPEQEETEDEAPDMFDEDFSEIYGSETDEA